MKTSFTIPMPPSVNALYANRPGGRFKTDAYKNWINLAALCIRDQKPAPISGYVAVRYVVATFTDKRKHDLGNLEKALSDCLTHHDIIDDDSQIRKITLEYSSITAKGFVEVTVTAVAEDVA